MKSKAKNIIKKTIHGPLEPIFSLMWIVSHSIQRLFFNIRWKLSGAPMPTDEEIKFMRENVTFIYKSFQRQKLAKRLYRNIQRYYPGVKTIIADDSRKPLVIKGGHVKIVHLPFNSGLSRGLNEALKLVETPFTVRLDDDELLTPYTQMHRHLLFLYNHTEVDLIGVSPYNSAQPKDYKSISKSFGKKNMSKAPKVLKVPHGTFLNNNYVVLGKVPNIFIARTEKYKEVGYDDNIRIIDHFEFFFRAAGNLVSALSVDSFVLHYHNPFKKRYRAFRGNYRADLEYIKNKHSEYIK